ncbi:hypothetical protein B0H12DRAFT_779870 [Mycena haematopus]|nr:hypothetical protein B0H12DRAFT_779870 [Mycena haematopus]
MESWNVGQSSAMLSHPNRNNKPSSYPVITPPPGHQRNRIACTNCRKKKIKCITAKKNPTSPCERCSKEGIECEYVAISTNEGTSSTQRPDILWVEPLDPESYARSQGAFPSPPVSHPHTMYAGSFTHTAGPPAGQIPPISPPRYSSSSQYFQPPGSSFQPGMPRMPGNQPPAAVNAAYPGTIPPPVYYGVSEPANLTSPWSQPQTQLPYDGCFCRTSQCTCGRRRAAY